MVHDMEIIGNLHSVSFPVNAQGRGPEMDKDKVAGIRHELWDDTHNDVATCKTVGIAEEIARRWRPRCDSTAEEDAKFNEKCCRMLVERTRTLGDLPKDWPVFAEYLKDELDKLRQAISDAGLAVMQTSGKWSIHDVAGKFTAQAKYDEAKTDEVIMENIELKKKLREAGLDQKPADPMECRSCGDDFNRGIAGYDGGPSLVCPACGSDKIGPRMYDNEAVEEEEPTP